MVGSFNVDSNGAIRLLLTVKLGVVAERRTPNLEVARFRIECFMVTEAAKDAI